MGLRTRLMIMITIVVAATDLIWYYHLTQNPAHLTLGHTLLVIFITIVPIFVILEYWHRRKWL
jgi:membrane protein YdbS with pleckstrin-like domain